MAEEEEEAEGMNFWEFLHRLSLRPPTVIFAILGFLLILFGWGNLYLQGGEVDWGKFLVGFMGTFLTMVAVTIEIQIRREKWKSEQN